MKGFSAYSIRSASHDSSGFENQNMKSSIYRPPRSIDTDSLNSKRDKAKNTSKKEGVVRGSGKGAVRPHTVGNHDGSRGTTGGYWVRNEGGKDANSLYKAPRGSYPQFDVEKGEERGSNSGPRVVGSDRGRKWSGIETDKANGPYESSLEWSSDNSESSSLLENPKFANLSISDQQQHTSHERR